MNYVPLAGNPFTTLLISMSLSRTHYLSFLGCPVRNVCALVFISILLQFVLSALQLSLFRNAVVYFTRTVGLFKNMIGNYFATNLLISKQLF